MSVIGCAVTNERDDGIITRWIFARSLIGRRSDLTNRNVRQCLTLGARFDSGTSIGFDVAQGNHYKKRRAPAFVNLSTNYHIPLKLTENNSNINSFPPVPHLDSAIFATLQPPYAPPWRLPYGHPEDYPTTTLNPSKYHPGSLPYDQISPPGTFDVPPHTSPNPLRTYHHDT